MNMQKIKEIIRQAIIEADNEKFDSFVEDLVCCIELENDTRYNFIARYLLSSVIDERTLSNMFDKFNDN